MSRETREREDFFLLLLPCFSSRQISLSLPLLSRFVVVIVDVDVAV